VRLVGGSTERTTMHEPTNRADNVLKGPWSDPAIREERQRLLDIVGDEEALRIEGGVFRRHFLAPFPDYQAAVLEALRERANCWTAERGW
jgi:hypothetical protein